MIKNYDSEYQEELQSIILEDNISKSEKSSFLGRLTKRIPIGVLLVGIIIGSGVSACIGYLVWTFDPDYLQVFFYFAIVFTVLGGVFLVYVLLCIFSKKFLAVQMRTSINQIGYVKQIQQNVIILFDPETFQNVILKTILGFLMLILLISTVGHIIFGLYCFVLWLIKIFVETAG